MTQEKRVLIVDGDAVLSEVLEARLLKEGYLVDFAHNGKDAIDVLNSTWIDLIVMEIDLDGDMNGFQLFKILKEDKDFQRIPVIVQTSKAAMRESFETMGVDEYFVKPYSVKLLIDEIKDILTKKILVLVSDKKSADDIISNIDKYGFQIDLMHDIHTYSYHALSFRYCIAIVQYKMSTNMDDTPIHIVRRGVKNTQVPVIVCSALKKSEMNKKEAQEAKIVKGRCTKLHACEFMYKDHFKKQFHEAAVKHLKMHCINPLV